MRDTSGWAACSEANADRARAAGRRDARLAAIALERLGDTCTPSQRAVAEARIADPDASWAQIARRLGLTKDVVIGQFRRMLARKAVRGA
jgi:DNA-binding transcriptional regulator WhiA